MGYAFLRRRNANSGGLVLFDNGVRVEWETGEDAGYSTIDTTLYIRGIYDSYGGNNYKGTVCTSAVSPTAQYSKLRYTLSYVSGTARTRTVDIGSTKFGSNYKTVQLQNAVGTYEIDISDVTNDGYISFFAQGGKEDDVVKSGEYKISKVELVR